MRGALLTVIFDLLHSARNDSAVGSRSQPDPSPREIDKSPLGGRQKCKERLSGLIIQKVMASSGAKMGQTCSFTIPLSWGTGIALCRKEIRSSLRLCRDPKVPRRPMLRSLLPDR